MSSDQMQRAYQLTMDLDHPISETRRRAAEELISIGVASEPALSELLEVADSATRRRVLIVLAEIKAPKAIPGLMDYVLNHPHTEDTRSLAMRGIINAVQPKHRRHCFEFFLQHLRDPDDFLAALAVEGLARLGDPQAKPFLEGAAQNSPSENVRTAAQRMLADFHLYEDTSIPSNQRAPEEQNFNTGQLEVMLASREAPQRQFAIDELIKRGEDAFGRFVQAIQSGHGLARQSGVRGLGALGDPRGLQILGNIAGNARTKRDERAFALRALVDAAPFPEMTPDGQKSLLSVALRAEQNPEDSFVLAAALELLSELKPTDLSPLTRGLQHAEPWIQEVAARSLTLCVSPAHKDIFPIVIRTLQRSGATARRYYQAHKHWDDEAFKLQKLLFEVLEQLAEPGQTASLQSIPEVSLFLQHPQKPLRISALEYLRHVLQSPCSLTGAALQAIIDALDTPDDTQRADVIELLEHSRIIPDASAIRRLREAAQRDLLPQLQRRIIELIASTRTPEARLTLEEIARNPSSPSAEDARIALSRWS